MHALRRLGLAFAVASAFATHAAPLANPALGAGQDILVENGEVTVAGFGAVTVVRYTWRDSAGNPRSVALVPASGSNSGYALRFTYVVGGNTVNVDAASDNGDGGFGYFVSHELYRDFDGDGSGDGTLAAIHGEDDSPLGRYLASTGSAQSAGTSQAAHEFKLNYPRWGTVAAMPDPDAQTSANAADHQRYQLPVVIRWHFVAGRDWPLWSVEYDQTAANDHIAHDVRGPYGVMSFNEGVGNAVTALRWGDKYKFVADAGAADIGAAAAPLNGTSWTWNTLNTGRRYNVLSSGSYEFGLVDTVPYSASRYGDSYADRRGSTKAILNGCNDGDPSVMQALPCTWEWAYQSIQFDNGPPARPKLAWGSSPYLGSSITSVGIGPGQTETIVPKGRVHYGVHIVLGKSGTGAPLTLARSAAAVETDPVLTIAASTGGSVSFSVLGDGTTYTSSRTLKPWDSVKLAASANPGASFTGWSGACAGVQGTVCLVTMDQSRSVSASFDTGGTNTVSVTPSSIDFGQQSMGTTTPANPATNVTVAKFVGTAVTISGVSIDNPQFSQTNNCGTLSPNQECTVILRFSPAPQAIALNGTASVTGTLTITSSASGSPHKVTLAGTAERSLVTHYYRSILRRTPDTSGRSFWSGEATRVTNLGANVNEVWYSMAQTFYFSPEYAAFNRNNTDFITDLYVTFFNRAPDSGGQAFWVGNLDQGMPREVALAEFMFSTEFRNFSQAIFGNVAARAEVNMVMDFYRGLLSRLPDDGGFGFWVGRFRSAQCNANPSAAIAAEVESISSAFALSAEYGARNRSNAQYVGDLYNAFLRRGGDLAGVQFWIGQVNSGAMTREQVRVQFKNSAEFQGRVNAVIAQGC